MELLPGVNILQKDTSNGAVTDFDGNYSLTLQAVKQILVFSFVGFQTIEGSTDQNQLLETIKQERKWELAGEYQEYTDLQRWGDIEKSLPNNEDAVLFGTVYSPKIELLPIPQNQIDANENLVQNPGY